MISLTYTVPWVFEGTACPASRRYQTVRQAARGLGPFHFLRQAPWALPTDPENTVILSLYSVTLEKLRVSMPTVGG